MIVNNIVGVIVDTIWDTFKVCVTLTGKHTVRFEMLNNGDILALELNIHTLKLAEQVCKKHPNNLDLLVQKGELIKRIMLLNK